MKKTGIFTYVATFALVLVLALQTASLTTALYADETSGGEAPSISDILNQQEQNTQTTQPTQAPTQQEKGNSVIDGITSGLDYSKVDSDIVDQASGVINYWVGVAVQILAYIITGALTLCKILDIMYIVVPPVRTYLANGYMGNAAAAGTPGGQMNGGMVGGPMGGGMMPGGMMGGGMGGYGRGRYGMGGGMMGGGMMGSPMGGMGMDSQMAMQNQPARGRIQFVSNAALNAVATESVLGTDGKGQSAFKVYFTDMIVSSVVTGILIVLCLTGVMAKLGFVIGDFIVEVVGNISVGA